MNPVLRCVWFAQLQCYKCHVIYEGAEHHLGMFDTEEEGITALNIWKNERNLK